MINRPHIDQSVLDYISFVIKMTGAKKETLQKYEKKIKMLNGLRRAFSSMWKQGEH